MPRRRPPKWRGHSALLQFMLAELRLARRDLLASSPGAALRKGGRIKARRAAAKRFASSTTLSSMKWLGTGFALPKGMVSNREKVLMSSLASSREEFIRRVDKMMFELGDVDDAKAIAIKKELGIAQRRAAFITRDQEGNIRAEVAAAHAASIGQDTFIWRTVGDSRVREAHAARNGKRYSFDKPPNGEMPGTPPNCRCWAEYPTQPDEQAKATSGLSLAQIAAIAGIAYVASSGGEN